MYKVIFHKKAGKSLEKAPNKIKEKVFIFQKHLREQGLDSFPFKIDTMKGEFKQFKYLEAKIDKDYRIIFRQEENIFYIRYAGTHNALGTG